MLKYAVSTTVQPCSFQLWIGISAAGLDRRMIKMKEV